MRLRDIPEEYARHWYWVGWRDGLICAAALFAIVALIYFASRRKEP